MRRYTLARAGNRKNLPISKRRDRLNAVVEGEAVVRFYLRHRQNRIFIGQVFAGLACIGTACALHGQTALQLTVNWDKTMLVSRSVPTLQVVVNPPLRPGEPLSAASYKAVKELGADYVRYVPWLPYPRLAVAELEPPTPQKTSWDFSLIDPMTKDFLNATEGHPTVMNFSTIPAWLFKTDKPVTYPADPNQVIWDYTQGTELRDPSGKELGDYYGRLVSWYVEWRIYRRERRAARVGLPLQAARLGGAERGRFRASDDPEAVHRALRRNREAQFTGSSPETKFMGMALGDAGPQSAVLRVFSESRRITGRAFRSTIISYHFYASPVSGADHRDWQYTFFDQADGFLNTVRYIENIRKRLSPRRRRIRMSWA